MGFPIPGASAGGDLDLGSESGDITTVVEAFGPVTIGGVFGNAASNAANNTGVLLPIAIVAAVVIGVIFFRR